MTASNTIIQDILNLKAKSNVKTASASGSTSKMNVLTDTLLKFAEEMEKEEEKKKEGEGEEKKESGEGENSESSSESKGEGEGESSENEEEKSASQAEDIVAAALAELDNTKNAGAKSVKIDYTKLAKEIMKVAVDGTGVYGLDKDMTASPKAEPGTVATNAQADAAKNITETNVTDASMGVKGPTDPMQGYAPQAAGGEETPLTPGEIKSAMAKLSSEDAVMLFKLAQVGYDVTVDVLSDEVVEKQAAAKILEQAERVKVAQAYNYLMSMGINPLAR